MRILSRPKPGKLFITGIGTYLPYSIFFSESVIFLSFSTAGTYRYSCVDTVFIIFI